MYGLQNAFGDKEEEIGRTTTIRPVTGAASDNLHPISKVITSRLIVQNMIKIFDKTHTCKHFATYLSMNFRCLNSSSGIIVS